MPDVVCPTCGQSWGDKATFCGACGDRLPGGPARSTAPAHDPVPPRNATRGRWVVAGAVVLIALVGGAAALVGGSGPPRDDGGDDEVAVPDGDDLQGTGNEQAGPPPQVACEREGEAVDCVRWMRRLVSTSPAPDMHSWWVEVTPEQVLARNSETILSLARATGEVLWQEQFENGGYSWVITDEVAVVQTPQGTRALSLGSGREQWAAQDTHLAEMRRPQSSGAIHTVHMEEGQSVLAAREADGTVRWRKEIEGGKYSSRQVPPHVSGIGSLAFVTLEDAGHDVTLVALGGEDGTERWRRADSRPIHATDDVALVMEVEREVEERGDSTTVSESPSALVGLDAVEGTERWRIANEEHVQFGIVDDVLVHSDADGLTGIDMGTGEERWHSDSHGDEHLLPRGPLWGGPIASIDVVLSVTADGTVLARDPATGEIRWRTELDGRVVHTTTVAEGTVVVWMTGSTFAHLDPATGDVLGTISVEAEESLMMAGPDIFVDAEAGWVVGIDLPPRQ